MSGAGASALASADLDGDGDRDLAVANGDSDDVTILRNGGGGNFTQPGSSPESLGDFPFSVAAGDFDGDADQDLAVANEFDDNVTILKNSGNGNFTEPASSPEPAGGGPISIAVANFDGDGDQDLAVANAFAGDLSVLRNNGNGNFAELASSPEAVGDFPRAVSAADLDGDADQDLAVANLGSDDVTILRNSGNGNFTEPASSPELAGDGPASVAPADFDLDGDRDLAVANNASSNVSILRNNGPASFNEVGSSPEAAGVGANFVVAAPLDGDADQDLAVTNLSVDTVTILGNQ